MNKEKIKDFMKDHKKEIILGGVAIGSVIGTAIYYWHKVKCDTNYDISNDIYVSSAALTPEEVCNILDILGKGQSLVLNHNGEWDHFEEHFHGDYGLNGLYDCVVSFEK